MPECTQLWLPMECGARQARRRCSCCWSWNWSWSHQLLSVKTLKVEFVTLEVRQRHKANEVRTAWMAPSRLPPLLLSLHLSFSLSLMPAHSSIFIKVHSVLQYKQTNSTLRIRSVCPGSTTSIAATSTLDTWLAAAQAVPSLHPSPLLGSCPSCCGSLFSGFNFDLNAGRQLEVAIRCVLRQKQRHAHAPGQA